MKFSVTIPAYKARFLNEAIESVVRQTYDNWELIIVDDHSPENLVEIVKPYLTDNRIQYYRNKKNYGATNIVNNWNTCLSYCNGDYVICMGDDDRLLSSCLQEYKNLINEIPGLNVYHARTEIIDEVGEVVNLQELRPRWESVLSLIWNRWDHRNRQYIGDFCYNVQYLKGKGGYYNLPLGWGSDDITAVQAAKEKGIANMQVYGFQYRENCQTLSNSTQFARTKIKATLTQYVWFNYFLETLQQQELSSTDLLYFNTIETVRNEYYTKSLGKDCSDYMKGNPFKLFECIRMLRQLKVSKMIYAKWYLKSLLIV